MAWAIRIFPKKFPLEIDHELLYKWFCFFHFRRCFQGKPMGRCQHQGLVDDDGYQ